MKRNVLGIIVVIVVTMFGVCPVFAQQEAGNDKTVSPSQGSTAKVEVPNTPVTPVVGIPPTLIDVRYRKCPIKRYKVNRDTGAIYEGKVYHFCSEECTAKFWENPQAVILKLKNSKEVPLTITNKDGKCPAEGKPASREFFRIRGDSVTFFCCADCSSKAWQKGYRSPVSRQATAINE